MQPTGEVAGSKMKRIMSLSWLVALALFITILPSAFASVAVKVDGKMAFKDSKAKAYDAMTSADGELTLQEWFDANGYTISVENDELGIETFQAGNYQIGILAELADYAALNNLSWYANASAELHLLFSGANDSGDVTTFLATETFGLAIQSPDGLFYTETGRNPDGMDHALVFANNAPYGGYIIAWEDLWEGGDEDFQDMVLAMLIPVVEARVCICPRTLNLRSRGRFVTCFIRLPVENVTDDVDLSTVRLNNTIPAEPKPVTILSSRRSHVKILIVKFNRAAVIEYIKDSLGLEEHASTRGRATLTVSGSFANGQAFEGSDRIRIIFPRHARRITNFLAGPYSI